MRGRAGRMRRSRQTSGGFLPFLLAAGVLALTASAFSGITPRDAQPAAERRSPLAFELRSTAFPAGGTIPKNFTCDGPDVSPSLSWTEPPAGTQSLALIMDDPDAPGRVWVHWVIFNLPAGARSLPEGVGKEGELPDYSRQGRNDFGKLGYNGPCPPRGPAHRYFFKLYALNAKLELKPGATKTDVERALAGHVIAQAELIGKFGH